MAVLILYFALLPGSDAGGLREADKTLPVVSHVKRPGGGYLPGSPLYKKEKASIAVAGPKAHPFDLHQLWLGYARKYSWTIVPHIVALLIIALLYRWRRQAHISEKEGGPSMSAYFRKGLFEWPRSNEASDWEVCMMALCCPVIRWASSMDWARDDQDKLSTRGLLILRILAISGITTNTSSMNNALDLFVEARVGDEVVTTASVSTDVNNVKNDQLLELHPDFANKATSTLLLRVFERTRLKRRIDHGHLSVSLTGLPTAKEARHEALHLKRDQAKGNGAEIHFELQLEPEVVHAKVPLLSYWKAIALMTTLLVFVPVTLGLSGLLYVAVGVYYRQRLRRILGHSLAHIPAKAPLDCIAWSCCSCCAIAQEAREVEAAWPA